MADIGPDRHDEEASAPERTGVEGYPAATRWCRLMAIFVSVLGAGALVSAGWRLSGGAEGVLRASPDLIWGLFPFVLAVFGLRRRRVGIPRSVAVILVSGVGLDVYAGLLWSSHLSSTAGRAFVFIPSLQTLGCGLALALTVKWHGESGAA